MMVFNMRTGEEKECFDLTPRQAVITAWEQERGNFDIWGYDFDKPCIETKRTIACGDWCTILK